jgi:SAM-dependent methyltransferase
MHAQSLFASPAIVRSVDDCDFYHVMDLPGHGLVGGAWDLRGGVHDYLGQFSFAGKRVLEIGPASGFLTFEMEKHGAEVVAVELAEDVAWDFVPYPDAVLAEMRTTRREHMARLRNSFWFAHAARGSSARVHYGDAYRLPDALGRFDVAVMASVLLHCHSPLLIIEQCARRADTLIIVELLAGWRDDAPVCRLVPTADNRKVDAWWLLSPHLLIQFCEVLGFCDTTVTTHEQLFMGKPTKLFTLVAKRDNRKVTRGNYSIPTFPERLWHKVKLVLGRGR